MMRIGSARVAVFFALIFISVACGLLRPASDVDDPPAPRPSSSEMRLRQDIVAFAKKYQGVKYKYAGKEPRTGFDCSGFTSYVMDHFDISLSGSSRLQEEQGRTIRPSEVQVGDLIFYRRSSGGRVFHVSLVIDNNQDGIKVIHATSRGVVIDNITASSYWKPKISTARDVISG